MLLLGRPRRLGARRLLSAPALSAGFFLASVEEPGRQQLVFRRIAGPVALPLMPSESRPEQYDKYDEDVDDQGRQTVLEACALRWFLPRDAMLAYGPVSVSVWLSVSVFICLPFCLSKWMDRLIWFFDVVASFDQSY